MYTQLLKRAKSFMWRGAMMALAVFVTYAMENLDMLELPAVATVLLGLVLGEVSKYLNTQKV